MRYRFLTAPAPNPSAGPAVAHIEYVTDSDEHVAVLEFLLTVVSDPLNALLLAGGGLAITLGIVGYVWRQPARAEVTAFRDAMLEYLDLVPWILRLSVGLPLVGAGFAAYLFSPEVPPVIPVVVAPSRLFQVTVGMMLLFGFASRVAALLGLVVYLGSVPFFPDLLLANEFVAGFLGIAILGSGRPSADHVLERLTRVDGVLSRRLPSVHRGSRWLDRVMSPYEPYVPTIVRVGLGLNFVYLGLFQKILAPGQALAVVEKYALTAVVPVDPGMWVVGVGLTEVLLGVLLVAGLLTRGVAAVAMVTFTATLFALPDDPVLAHVSLFGLTSALLVMGSGPLALDQYLPGGLFTESGASPESPAPE